MATATHGKDGTCKWGGSAIALVDAWDANVEPAYDDITSEDSGGWQQLLPGIKKVTGSIKVRVANDDTAGQTAMKAAAIGATAAVLTLNAAGTANALSGTAYLSLAVSSPHGAPNEATFNFSSTGPWTYA